MEITRIRNVKMPDKGHEFDAGFDFYLPEFNEQFISDFFNHKGNSQRMTAISKLPTIKNNILTIPPGENAVIPSGIKINILKNFVGIFLNKSSIAGNKDCLIGAQVIDSGYSGEIHIDLHNVNPLEISFLSEDKIGQLLIIPVYTTLFEEITNKEYEESTKNVTRGNNGFGSTNK